MSWISGQFKMFRMNTLTLFPVKFICVCVWMSFTHGCSQLKFESKIRCIFLKSPFVTLLFFNFIFFFKHITLGNFVRPQSNLDFFFSSPFTVCDVPLSMQISEVKSIHWKQATNENVLKVQNNLASKIEFVHQFHSMPLISQPYI